MAVTRVPLVNQWAETTNTADGTGICFPMSSHLLLNSLSSIPFIGEPWPTNKTGMRYSRSFRSLVNLLNSDILFIFKTPFLFNGHAYTILIQWRQNLFYFT